MKRKNLKLAVTFLLIITMVFGCGSMAFAVSDKETFKTTVQDTDDDEWKDVKDDEDEWKDVDEDEWKDVDEDDWKDEPEEKEQSDGSSGSGSGSSNGSGSSLRKKLAAIIADFPTIQAFTSKKVAEKDMEAILKAGYNSPNSMNKQPWHFSAITGEETLKKLADSMSFGKPSGDKPADMPSKPEGTPPASDKDKPADTPSAPQTTGAKAGIGDAPLVIVVSCKEGSELDAGIAVQNMAAEALLLGYGTKIISSPTIVLNGDKQAEYKELLGIPEDMSAVCVLLVGQADDVEYDAVTSATVRNAEDELVTIVK